jgi:hypothetical protein
MMSKTAINWAAGLGVAAFVTAGAFAVKYYDARPGAATSPLALQSAPAVAPSPPATRVAATPAAPAPAAVQPAAPSPAPAPAATPAAIPDQAAPDQPRPAFDVVRVEPTGDAVIAGRASPLAAVEVRADGRVVAETSADGAGQFAILPPPFSAGGHRLQLAARLGGAPEVLSDAIGIDVPATPSPTPAKPAAPASQMSIATKPVAAAPPPKAPPAETPKLAWLGAAPLTDATAAPRVSVLSVEASGAGRLEARGAAEANKLVRLYLNNAFLAEATAGADGRWSLTVERGMTPGAYAIRADQIDRANGAVTARAEVPFTYPERPSPQQSAGAAPQPSASLTAAAKPAAPQSSASLTAAAKPSAPDSAASLTVAAKPVAPVQVAAASRSLGPIEPAATRPPAATAPSAAPLVAMSESTKPSEQAAPPPAPQPTAAASPVEPAAPAGEKTKPSVEAPASAAPALEAVKPAELASSALATKVLDQPLAPSAAPAEASAAASVAAETTAPQPAAVAAAASEKSADAVVQEIRTAKVVRGDSLWRLSEHFYGYGPRYRAIYEANATQIRNPRLIYPNQIFVVPKTN